VDRAVWTYNQGTVVGAEVQLWQQTGDRTHLDRARRTAGAMLDRYGEGGFPVEGTGDGSVFKGILARYLGDLVMADPDGSQRVRAALTGSGSALAAAAGAPIGIDWQHPATSEVGLGSEVSGALLLEALARLERPM
jgi:predicted alpha-1,6-mannanase (GH76 family)